jgi:hypothetical protein
VSTHREAGGQLAEDVVGKNVLAALLCLLSEEGLRAVPGTWGRIGQTCAAVLVVA